MKSTLIFLVFGAFVGLSVQQEYFGSCDYELAVLQHPVANLCNKYLVCVFKQATEWECPEGKVFFPQEGANPPFGKCEPGFVQYCSRTSPPPPTTTTTTIPPPDGICDGIIFGRVPSPDNCYEYYQCSLGRASRRECAPRQIFVPQAGLCFRGDRNTCETCFFC